MVLNTISARLGRWRCKGGRRPRVGRTSAYVGSSGANSRVHDDDIGG